MARSLWGAQNRIHTVAGEAVTYPPLNTLKPVADSLWIVDSGPMKVLGMIPIPIRMTLLRLRDGAILLHSPTAYSPQLKGQIEQLGPIRHIVAPDTAHWTHVKPWQDHCLGARTWAAPGLSKRRQVRNSGVRIDGELNQHSLTPWQDEMAHFVVEGLGFAELVFVHRPSKAIIFTDLVQNLEAAKLPSMLRPLAALTGATEGKAPIYLRAVVQMKRRQAAQAVREALALKPELAIFSHGRWFDRHATERLKQSLAWLIG